MFSSEMCIAVYSLYSLLCCESISPCSHTDHPPMNTRDLVNRDTLSQYGRSAVMRYSNNETKSEKLSTVVTFKFTGDTVGKASDVSKAVDFEEVINVGEIITIT